MKKILTSFFIIFFIYTSCFAQGEVDEQSKIFYRNEKSAGLVLNTCGFGMNLRYGQRVDYLNKRLYEMDLSFVKDLKEVKISNPYFPNNRGFVFGKLNSFFHLSGGYGHQHEVFRKFDVGGISIRYCYSGGATLGFYKPIYYDILYPISSSYEFVIETEKFNPTIHQATDIYGRASFLKGFDELKLVPGIYGKFGVSFEYSKYDEVLHAIDIGLQLHTFLTPVPIMAGDKHSRFFPAIYVSYHIGKIFDPKMPKSKSKQKPRQRMVVPPDIEYF
jgi:hypothetical protein